MKIQWKDWCWNWKSNTLVTWCEEMTHWKRPWCWKRLKAGGEGDYRDEMVRWHHWLQCTQVWASSGIWWWTGKLGVLQSMGLQSQTWLRDWTELNWLEKGDAFGLVLLLPVGLLRSGVPSKAGTIWSSGQGRDPLLCPWGYLLWWGMSKWDYRCDAYFL